MLEVMRRRLPGLVQLIDKRQRKPVYTDFEDLMGGETAIDFPGFVVGTDPSALWLRSPTRLCMRFSALPSNPKRRRARDRRPSLAAAVQKTTPTR